MMRGDTFAYGALWGIWVATAAWGGPAPAWRDEPVARLEATALLYEFEADLLGGGSATATLEQWCGVHGLASPARVTAERIHEDTPAPAELRSALGVDA